MKNKLTKRKARHTKVRKKVQGRIDIPRLSVFRSNKHIYAQIIDDVNQKTITASTDLSVKKVKGDKNNQKVESAFLIGEQLAKMAIEKKVKKVVFDRGGYKFHGRVKALAEGARKGGLIF